MNDTPELSLHHVGYAVKTIEPAAEAYANRYGYEISTPIIHDPLQTAFVQFLKLPGDRVYLEFVAPDSPESKLSGAVKRSGKLHHLCYAANKLETSIDQLEDTGMLLISEPKPAIAFAGRRICWLIDDNSLLLELVERRDPADLCIPGQADPEPGGAGE